MKSLVVLVALAACAHTCLAVPTPAPTAEPVPVAAEAAAKLSAAPAVPAAPAEAKPEGPPAVPVVPAEPAMVKPAVTAPPTAQDAVPAAPAPPPAADVANKMGHLVAVPALNSSKAAISVQVLPPLLPKCSSDGECVAQLGQHSACRDFWCECVDGAKYESGFSRRCLREVSAIGDACKETGDCRRIANTYCKAGSCHCNKDFVFSDDGTACLRVATAEDASCTEPRQCVRLLNSATAPQGPAVCVEGKCMCRYDHVFQNGTCVHKQARGKACASDAECGDLDGGACTQGVCGCKAEHVPAVAANKCLPVRRAVEDACEEDIQCSEAMGDMGRCSAGKCACPDRASLGEDGKCACGERLVHNKDTNTCESSPPTQPQKSVKKNGASSLQSSMTVVAVLVCAAHSVLPL